MLKNCGAKIKCQEGKEKCEGLFWCALLLISRRVEVFYSEKFSARSTN